MYKSLYFFMFFALFAACGGEQSKSQKIESDKWAKVMANHDEVMPMMGTTNKVRKKLNNLLEEEANLPNESIEKIKLLVQNLDQADEGMMDWMNGLQQLKKLRKIKNHQEILKYLDDQDVQIKKVGIDMTNSINEGLKFIEKIGEQ